MSGGGGDREQRWPTIQQISDTLHVYLKVGDLQRGGGGGEWSVRVGPVGGGGGGGDLDVDL